VALRAPVRASNSIQRYCWPKYLYRSPDFHLCCSCHTAQNGVNTIELYILTRTCDDSQGSTDSFGMPYRFDRTRVISIFLPLFISVVSTVAFRYSPYRRADELRNTYVYDPPECVSPTGTWRALVSKIVTLVNPSRRS
jgi:hypothetical protein